MNRTLAQRFWPEGAIGQRLRSNGGLFSHGYAEFAEALRLVLQDDALAASLGRQGQAYVDREYAWETIDEKLEGLLARTEDKALDTK